MADLYQSKFYRTWSNMKTRCTNENTKDFKRYGARGISVCDKWQTFSGFFDDMYKTYKENLTLDRIDNNGNYYKENCRWVSPQIQANNRRSNRIIEYNGKIKTLEEWVRFLGLKSSTIRQRLYVYGWSVDKAFTKFN